MGDCDISFNRVGIADFYMKFGGKMLTSYPHHFHTGNIYFTIQEGEFIIGCACLENYYDKVGIMSKLLVHPNYRGKGIGSELVHRRLRFGIDELNLHTFYSFVRVDNEVSIHLLEKMGFDGDSVIGKEDREILFSYYD